MSSPERLRIGTKMAFGVGAAAEAAISIAFNTWNFLFYNNVLGLSGTLCGLAVTISLVLDAVADPVIGFLSDRWRSKLGRRHPFLYTAAVPLALSFYCIYVPPAGMSQFLLFLWFTFFTVLFRQCLTLYQVPHLALGAELSKDYRERSIVMAYNSIFAVVGGSFTYFYGWTWLKLHGGTSVRAGYPGLAAGVGMFVAVVILASAYFTRDQIPRLLKNSDTDPRFNLPDLLRETWDCLKNKNYRTLLAGLVFISATLGTGETLTSYMSLFYWGLPEGRIREFATVTPPAFFISFFLTVWLHTKFGKRETIIGAVFVTVLTAALPVLLRIAGVMPPNGSPELVTILKWFVFFSFGSGAVLTISVLSALADVADEHEITTGRRQEGVFFAARTFFAKLTSGFGHIVAGLAIDLIQFPHNAKPGEVSAEVLHKLGWVAGPIAAIPAVISIYFYSRYSIDRQRHAEMQRELQARKKPVAPEPDLQRLEAAEGVAEQVTSTS